ncbi:MAG TPA: hypothetical protein VHF47_13535 [Acidimicrobiales bacterium]|nr:hypothetical protein [Acidimicrobiales bacterium]
MALDDHAFKARLPADVWSELRTYAYLSKLSVNEVVVKAVRSFLAQEATAPEVRAMIEAEAARLRRLLEEEGRAGDR